MKRKHAYLIMAHNNFDLLKILIKLLDDERNDIYVHIDKKSNDFNEEYIKRDIKHSKILFIDRMKVTWGGYSQIECEMKLLKESSIFQYDYYHFLSGIDLLLKNQDYIHEFFERNNGKEFIHFCSDEFNKKSIHRYSIYHLFQDIVGRNKNILYYFEKILIKIQSKISFIQRINRNIEYVGGSNWCSLTHKCVKYIVESEKLIKQLFKYTLCCDEFFIQTLVKNSKFYEDVYKKKDTYSACMRYIDWERGNPYVFNIDDWGLLYNSEFLFARKFNLDSKEQKLIVEKIYKEVSL